MENYSRGTRVLTKRTNQSRETKTKKNKKAKATQRRQIQKQQRDKNNKANPEKQRRQRRIGSLCGFVSKVSVLILLLFFFCRKSLQVCSWSSFLFGSSGCLWVCSVFLFFFSFFCHGSLWVCSWDLFFIQVWLVWRTKNEGRKEEQFSQRTRKELECLKLKFHMDFKSTSTLPTHRTRVS